MNLLVKIILTILLVAIGIYPYFEAGDAPGGLTELQSLGIFWSLIIVVVFFIAIAYYCKTLQKVLELVQPQNRTRKPKSVWFMYLIPYNFIEDFFIVIDISNALKNELESNMHLSKFGDFGLTLGIGWSIAQIFSFVPNLVGQVAGFVGLILWIIHWRLMMKIIRALQFES